MHSIAFVMIRDQNDAVHTLWDRDEPPQVKRLLLVLLLMVLGLLMMLMVLMVLLGLLRLLHTVAAAAGAVQCHCCADHY